MDDIIFDEHKLDNNFSKYDISSYYEMLFYEIFTLNYWTIIKEIDNYSITFENDVKIKFEIKLIDIDYFYLMLYKIKDDNILLIFQQMTNINMLEFNIKTLVNSIIFFLNIPY